MVDALGFDNGQSERVFRLGGGEAESALQRGFPDGGIRGFELGGFEDAVQHDAELAVVWQAEIDVGDFMFEFGGQLETAAQQDDRMAVAFGDAQDVLDPAHEHGIALVHVELQVSEQHDMARAVGGEHAIEELEGVQRIGAGGDAAFLGIDQALAGGPGVEAAFEGGADGGDFRFGACFFGTDDSEAGIAGGTLCFQFSRGNLRVSGFRIASADVRETMAAHGVFGRPGI